MVFWVNVLKISYNGDFEIFGEFCFDVFVWDVDEMCSVVGVGGVDGNLLFLLVMGWNVYFLKM